MQKTNPSKYASEINKGMEYLNDNTLAYIESYPGWEHFLASYFISTYALIGNQSMVDKLFSEYVAWYGDGVAYTHEIQLTHAGNASINSVLYHVVGLNAMLSAYNATGNGTYLGWAWQIADHTLLEHWDSGSGYFTNLNEMDTSRSNYCNYQKGLAEINGVAAYALMKFGNAAPQALTSSSFNSTTFTDVDKKKKSKKGNGKKHSLEEPK